MNISIIVNKSEVLTLSLCIFAFPADFHYLPYHFDRSGQFKEKKLHPSFWRNAACLQESNKKFPATQRVTLHFFCKENS